MDLDTQVRLKAFDFANEKRILHGDAVPYDIWRRGFLFEGRRVPLISPQGIFKPAILDLPLTFNTVPIVEGRPRPYEDEIDDDGRIRYRYRGTDPNHRDNVGLRLCMERQIPLMYLYGVVKGLYMPIWPVYIVQDHPASLSFSVEAGDARTVQFSDSDDTWMSTDSAAQRAYITVSAQRRLHQQSFRQRVLRAYHNHCSICLLKHEPLLDAAHILPDGHPQGEPWVCNGLALCKLHHAAFDSNIIGIRPDLVVEVRKDILDEIDGPMLQHGLKDCHDSCLSFVPSTAELKPKPVFLEERYELFRASL